MAWECEEYEEGWVFHDPENDRRIEVLPETGGDWAAELYHYYGATRLVLMKTDDGADVLAKLVNKGTLDKEHLP